MGTKPRLPTNVIDGLEDCIALLADLWDAIEALCKRAQEQGDVIMLANLNSVVLNVATLERYVKAARKGEYAGKQEARQA